MIHEIPARAFDDAQDITLDLSNLDIHELSPNAFEGTLDLKIDLTGNYIVSIDPLSTFPQHSTYISQCTDNYGWKNDCEALALINNDDRCFHRNSCDDSKLVEINNLLQQAKASCCAFGGGMTKGRNLLMEKSSPMYCFPDEFNYGNIICACSSEGARYDYLRGECIQSCEYNQKWQNVTNGTLYQNVFLEPELVGTCVSCPEGEYSDRNSWEYVIIFFVFFHSFHSLLQHHTCIVAIHFLLVNMEQVKGVRQIRILLEVLLSAPLVLQESIPRLVHLSVFNVISCINSQLTVNFQWLLFF